MEKVRAVEKARDEKNNVFETTLNNLKKPKLKTCEKCGKQVLFLCLFLRDWFCIDCLVKLFEETDESI